MSDEPKEIEFLKVTKRFGAITACDAVSFSVKTGSVHGLVGENGAGKSTLMKMLYGLYRPDSGEISLRGTPTRITRPQDAISHGIGMVHQHFMLVPTLSVWRNVILGQEGSFLLREADALERLMELKRSYGFTVDLKARVENLPVGEQQQVEILKLLYRQARVLVLDEPTAVLTPQEVEALFTRLRDLKSKGTTIVLITHKLREVLALCDSVTVLRAGKVVATENASALTANGLAELIVGKTVPALPRTKAHPSAVVVRVEDLSLRRSGRQRLSALSFEVRRGEIVGIAGVSGNGQEELVQVLSGVAQDYSGSVKLKGDELAALSLYETKQKGLAVIPSDRLHEAAVLSFPVWENVILGHHREKVLARGPLLSETRSERHASVLLDRFGVRPRDTQLKFGSLSGGNQQKLVIGRETHSSVDFLVAAYPTRGVDIGAIQAIHSHFLALRDRKAGIVLVSSELDEILAISDRIFVMYDGKFAGQCLREEANERKLGLWMTGCQA